MPLHGDIDKPFGQSVSPIDVHVEGQKQPRDQQFDEQRTYPEPLPKHRAILSAAGSKQPTDGR